MVRGESNYLVSFLKDVAASKYSCRSEPFVWPAAVSRAFPIPRKSRRKNAPVASSAAPERPTRRGDAGWVAWSPTFQEGGDVTVALGSRVLVDGRVPNSEAYAMTRGPTPDSA
jgi:hypothetical protein